VSLSSSIFQKPCPGCASSVSVSAARCDCGHVFETASSNLSPLEASLRDEELYESYLTARAEQAHQVSYAAEQALAEELDNPELASASALAKEVAKSLDDDLAEQRKKVAVIQDVLRKREQLATKPVAVPVKTESVVPETAAPARSIATSTAPVSPVPEAAPGIPESIVVAENPAPPQSIATTTAPVRPAPEAAPGIPVPIVAAEKVAAEKPAPTKTTVTITAAPKRPSRTTVEATISAPIPNPPAAVTNPVKPASVPTWQATTAQKAAGVLAALKNAKVRETVARAKKAMVAAAAGEQTAVPHAEIPAQPTPATANAPSAAPPSAFRKEQASKAEKIMEARKSVDTKECPNCTSNVPINTTRCQCGFTFITGGTELPSLTLCTGDFTALRNSLKLNLR
jgi:hypothetical protein